LFGRKTRAEKLREEALDRAPVPGATLAAAGSALATAYGGVLPILERLLYDDDLRDNIRTFIDSARNILDELSNESPTEIATKLWDDNKLRGEVETAVEAAEEGVKRLRGERVRGGGLSFGMLLLLLALGGGFLFFSPWTGQEARRIARQAFGTLRSGT
jgi:hypothetical protein